MSIDGPQEFHDEYRKNRQGRPSFTKVMQGIHLLKKHGVEWNALAVVNDFNADYPLDFYHFFKEIDCHYIQFTPIVERISPHADGRHLASPLQEDERLADFSPVYPDCRAYQPPCRRPSSGQSATGRRKISRLLRITGTMGQLPLHLV